jgi:hypothetical protein
VILIAHSSTASATSDFLPSIALFVLHVGLTPLFEVETDSNFCLAMVPVGVVIAVIFTVAIDNDVHLTKRGK